MNTTLIPKPITSAGDFIPLLARCTRFKAEGLWGTACIRESYSSNIDRQQQAAKDRSSGCRLWCRNQNNILISELSFLYAFGLWSENRHNPRMAWWPRSQQVWPHPCLEYQCINPPILSASGQSNRPNHLPLRGISCQKKYPLERDPTICLWEGSHVKKISTGERCYLFKSPIGHIVAIFTFLWLPLRSITLGHLNTNRKNCGSHHGWGRSTENKVILNVRIGQGFIADFRIHKSPNLLVWFF